jgi:DNA mismatch repair protein MutS
MEQELPGIRNYNIAVKKRGDDITFLRRIVRGPADDSYGIEVAKLAGIPDSVVSRAKAVLRSLLEGDAVPSAAKRQVAAPDSGQLSLLGGGEHPLVQQLRELDVNTLTPIEAMQVLYRLCEESKQY